MDSYLHVVIVEDDRDIGFLLLNYLDREDWIEAVHIATPEAAMDLEVWSYRQGTVLGIIDLMLPGYSGITVAQWVVENVPNRIPLIGITAADKDSTIFREAEASSLFDVVCEKPIAPKLLLDHLRITSGYYDHEP